MFKLTGASGYRKAGGGGAAQTGRVSGLTQLRGAPVDTFLLRKPPFVPIMGAEEGYDSTTPRVNETA